MISGPEALVLACALCDAAGVGLPYARSPDTYYSWSPFKSVIDDVFSRGIISKRQQQQSTSSRNELLSAGLCTELPKSHLPKLEPV